MRLFSYFACAASIGLSHALETDTDLVIDGGPDGWNRNSWGAVVDVVMGGQSSGFLTFVEPHTMHFTGTISLVNGGVAMVRTSDSRFTSDLSDYDGLILEFEVSEASAAPLAVSINLYGSDTGSAHATSVALPPGSADSNVYKVGVRFDHLEHRQYYGRCSNCNLDLDRLTGISVGVWWQEGDFEFDVLSLKASNSILEYPDMYYELFMAESRPSDALSCGDDISSVMARAELAKNANSPDIGRALYSALATQFAMGSSCAPEQLALILSAQEESRSSDSSTVGFNAFKSAFASVEEWEPDTAPAVHIPIDGGAEWNEGSWNLVLDSVMGGQSSGDFSFNSDGLLFSGTVNTNGGGFVQMETTFSPLDLSSADGIVIEMKLLDPAVAQAPLAFGLELSDSSNRYAVAYTAPVVVPFAPNSDAQDTYTVGVKWDAFAGRRMGFPMSGELDTTRVQRLKIDVVYVDGPFEVQFLSIAAESGIFDPQDLYTAVLPSHPPLEVLQSKIDVVLAQATYLEEHQFDDFAVALMSGFGRQMLLADGPESTELKESLLSHMVASRDASSTAEAIELLQSGLSGMDGIVQNPGEDTNGQEEGNDSPPSDSPPSDSSSSDSSQRVSLAVGVAVGLGVFAVAAVVLFKRRAKQGCSDRMETKNSRENLHASLSSEDQGSDDGLLLATKTGGPITSLSV